jgi:hypothetical protein
MHRRTRNRHVIGEDRHVVVLGGAEFNDGAAAHAQELMDWHLGRTQDDRDIDADFLYGLVHSRHGIARIGRDMKNVRAEPTLIPRRLTDG